MFNILIILNLATKSKRSSLTYSMVKQAICFRAGCRWWTIVVIHEKVIQRLLLLVYADIVGIRHAAHSNFS